MVLRSTGVPHQPQRNLGQCPRIARGIRNPVTPCSICSLMAPTAVVITGRPEAMASMMASGSTSASVGKTNMSARAYSAISSGAFGPRPWCTRTPLQACRCSPVRA